MIGKYLKIFLYILVFVAAIFLINTCTWEPSNETKILQHGVNARLYGKTTEEILDILGQPSWTEIDTIADIPITKLHYEDKVVLKHYANYSDKYQTEEPYINVYIKAGQAYSTKTNMVDTVISDKEVHISIVGICIYSGVLLLFALAALIGFLSTKTSVIKDLRLDRNFLHESLEELSEQCSRAEKKWAYYDSRFCQLSGWLEKLRDTQEVYESSLKLVRTDIRELSTGFDTLKKIVKTSFNDRDVLKRTIDVHESSTTPANDLDSSSELKHDENNTPNPGKSFLERNIRDLDLSARAFGCLKAANIETIGDLCTRSWKDLKHQRNVGKKTLAEIRQVLEQHGLSLGMGQSKYGITEKTTSSAED